MVKKINTTTAQTTQTQDSTELELQSMLENLKSLQGPGGAVLPQACYTNLSQTRLGLSRVLYYYDLYRKILDTPGCICEFGVRFGDTLSLFTNLRGILEPYNYTRRVIGFDTFEGFPSVNPSMDTTAHEIGECTVPVGYEVHLDAILDLHEKMAPVAHIKKHELIKGDASTTFRQWLKSNPQVCIAMAILDMDLYDPTLAVLKDLLPHMPKGSLLVFDEFSYPYFPGEAVAVKEVLGLHNLRLHMNPHQPSCAWAVIGEH